MPLDLFASLLHPRSARVVEGGRNAGRESEDRRGGNAYPEALEEWIDWQGTRVLLRPIRPDDSEAHLRFARALAPDDVRYRMFMAMKSLPPAQLARFTQIDYDREMAFIATRLLEQDDAAHAGPAANTGPADGAASARGGLRAVPAAPVWETLGVARVVTNPASNEGEFAIIVRSDLKGCGLGRILMRKLIEYGRSRGLSAIVGEALSDNTGLRRLVRRLGFTVDPSEYGVRGLRLLLQEKASGATVTGSAGPTAAMVDARQPTSGRKRR